MINKLIDYTLLRQDVRPAEILALCEVAIANRYATVCVPPYCVQTAAVSLGGSSVRVCTVIGFPMGYQLPEAKAAEARQLITLGASEIDAVINLAAYRAGDWQTLDTELSLLRQAVPKGSHLLKVILETWLLTLTEIEPLALVCVAAGVDFVKTSTGFAAVGAELEKVAYLRQILPIEVGIKASGGIRDLETARKFVAAGAIRIGTSAAITEL